MHPSLERCDLHGRPFSCAVDAEHKATELQICSFKQPHMRTFHASWMGFFSTFFSTFAPAPLAAYLKREDTLGLYCRSAGAKARSENCKYWSDGHLRNRDEPYFVAMSLRIAKSGVDVIILRCLCLQDGDGHREREHRLGTTWSALCADRNSDVGKAARAFETICVH